jgi:hypothetical protein
MKNQRLPVTARGALMVLVYQIEAVSNEIAMLDTALRTENKASELGLQVATTAGERRAARRRSCGGDTNEKTRS